MAYRRSSNGYGGNFGDSVGSMILLLAVVMLVIAVYLFVQMVSLVARVMIGYPKVRALKVLLAMSLGAWGLVGTCAILASQGVSLHPLTLVAVICCGIAIVATALLVIVARVVELANDTLAQVPVTPQTLVQNVLRRPWWQTQTP